MTSRRAAAVSRMSIRNNHELLASKDIGSLEKIYLHIVDTVALVHALIIRLQAIVLPLKVLVFGGHGGGGH